MKQITSKIVFALIITGFSLFTYPAARAQWVQTSGPFGKGNVTALTFTNGFLLAGTDSGYVFRSSDEGAHWLAAQNGLPVSAFINCFETVGSNLFVGTSSNGIYRSSDDGQSWQETNFGLLSLTIYSLFAVGDTLYAGVADSGVYRSTDLGGDWTTINNGINHGAGTINDETILSLAGMGNILYAGCFDGIYYSTDKGLHWTISHVGEGNSFTTMTVIGNYFFVATSMPPYELFLSKDSAIDFEGIFDFLSLGDRTLPIVLTNLNNILLVGNNSGVSISNDSGAAWVDFSTGFNSSRRSVYSFSNINNSIYAGTDSGVWRRPIADLASPKFAPVISTNRDTLIFNVSHSASLYYDTVTITNSGNAALHIDSVNINDKAFIIASNIPTSLDSGQSTQIILRLTYLGQNDTTVPLIITTNDPAHPLDTVYLKISSNTSVSETATPEKFSLGTYPNPFSATTTIAVEGENVSLLKVYDALGREAADLTSQINSLRPISSMGSRTVEFNASGLPNGVFFVRLTANGAVQTKMMEVMR